ncbi:MAG: 50S ribosomal protein L11 methyltransferase [Neisseriaceae bacterium]|nr:50S ribosomal protein L11 methyltransferase [Neisseriaceae bacterium]
MSYREMRIILPSQYAESLSDALMEQGALSSAIEDAYAGTEQEQAIFGEPGEPTGIWDNSLLLALFDETADIEQIIQAACEDIQISVPSYQITEIPEQDWVRITQAQFDPIRISERLWIVPSWHDAPDEQAINLKLDPGLAFGTGSHPTTRLCLQWLDQHMTSGQTVLDYGCGSGILAIAALKLGAKSADGVDIDPQAVEAAQANAQTNNVEASFRLPESVDTQTYDIVLANILANPLRLLGELLASHVKTGGSIVLSGILESQAEEISEIYSQWFTMNPPVFDEGWTCLTGIKKAA